jgi:hypothetical protein
MLSLDDGRDLLQEVVIGGWRVGFKILNIVEMLPDFVERVTKEE